MRSKIERSSKCRVGEEREEYRVGMHTLRILRTRHTYKRNAYAAYTKNQTHI
jgi:hypothetical protein